jgi:PBP1b-binding outer membrane lipoprotein LpoB
MTIRTLRLGAAAVATLALAACTKAAEPAKTDSTAAANATQTVTTPVDSSVKVDSSAKPDSSAPKPAVDSAKPEKK